MRHPLLDALAASLAGFQKSAASEVWPGLSESSQKSRLSRVLDGSLAIPPELLDAALNGPHRSVLLDYFSACGADDPSTLRREVMGELVRLRGQLELAFDRLERADEAERRVPEHRRMVRAEAEDEPRRGRRRG